MAFDPFWRLDLLQNDYRLCSDGKPATESGADPARDSSEFDELDEAEMNRFLDWLEESLCSSHSNTDQQEGRHHAS